MDGYGYVYVQVKFSFWIWISTGEIFILLVTIVFKSLGCVL